MESATSHGILDDPIETLVDRAKGFEQAADLLQDGERVQSLATEMVALSGVANQGTTIEEACSTGGAIHRAWTNFKHTQPEPTSARSWLVQRRVRPRSVGLRRRARARWPLRGRS